MYPYPSGDLHTGHWYAFAVPDATSALSSVCVATTCCSPSASTLFGLPAENAAIQHHIHPYQWTMANIERMRRQFGQMGAMFDWSRGDRYLPAGVLPLEPVVFPGVL